MEFVLRLYKEASQSEDGNLFISPFSVSSTLAMLLLGSDCATSEQLQSALAQGLNSNDFHRQNGALLKSLRDASSVTLNSANKLYPDSGFQVKQQFQDLCVKFYDTLIEPASFKDDPETARSLINKWVEQQTNDKIKDLLASGSVRPDTSMVLVNAVYFKGDWERQFEITETRKMPFHCCEGTTKEVQMMARQGKYKMSYDQNLRLKVVELPYVGNEVAMVLLVPDKNFDLNEIEGKLSAQLLTQLVDSLAEEEVLITLPKFKLEYQLNGLIEILQAMGVGDLFDPNKANLGGISDTKGLHVSKIGHKAFVEVNENGTEAAAATAAFVTFAMALPPVVVNCDHPFMFLIRHRPTKTVLFAGKYTSPKDN